MHSLDKKGRNVRKLGSGKKAAFPELEQKLFEWVTDRNQKGLRIKDKYIVARALALKEEILSEQPEEDLKELKAFKASVCWCNRFKNRFRLVSRRHTTTRTLPDDFKQQAQEFIADIQNLITAHNIEPKRTVNFDQVPRYFETENNSTITKKGTREVHLRKASTSHKRFTFTPVITAAGDIIGLHLLLSNLKNKPKVDPSCVADVNKTGMFNDSNVTTIIDDIILKKCQTPFRDPILILLDAYGTHTKFVKEKGASYEQRKIFLRVIPAKMTGLLQPLDVAVNRGFQLNYNDHFTTHMNTAINSEDETTRTKAGNVKMPTHLQISEWVRDWAKEQSKEAIAK